MVSSLQDIIWYDRHCHWILWRTGTDFLHLWPIQFTVSLILFFSYFPATFQKFQGVNRISQTVKKLRVRHSERCAPVLEPVSLFLLLQLSPSAGSCVFLILTTLRPLISPSDSFQAPRGQHGSAKTSVKNPDHKCTLLKRTHASVHHTNVHKNQQFSTPSHFCN